MISNLKTNIIPVVISLVFASAAAYQSSSNNYWSEDKVIAPLEHILLGVLESKLSS